MRPDASSASAHEPDPGGCSEPLIEDQAVFSIELRAIPKSVQEVKEAARGAFEQIKLRPQYLGSTDAQLAELYLAIESAIVESRMKHQASSRAMRRVKQELSKIGRALENLGKG